MNGAPRITIPHDWEEATTQINRALELLVRRIPTTGVGANTAAIAALQAQINQLNNLNGSDVNTSGTGVSGPSNNPAFNGVLTDGTTISGDGLNSNIALIKPVTLRAFQSAVTPYAWDVTDGPLDFLGGSAGAGADQVVDLPAATGTFRWIVVKKMDANAHNIVVTRAGADTIDGATTATITIQYDSVRLLDLASTVWALW